MVTKLLKLTTIVGLTIVSALALANDYELVVPQGWTGLKEKKVLFVYSTSGLLAKGDRIIAIKPGARAEKGISVQVGPGQVADRVLLAAEGLAQGYDGRIHLIQGNATGPVTSATLTLVVPPPVNKPAESKTGAAMGGFLEVAKGLPWSWILGVIGVLAVFALYRRNAPAGSGPFYGRKGVEERLKDVLAKLDDLERGQERLVKNPPVMRAFRRQIDTFEDRLKALEHESQQALKASEAQSMAMAKLQSMVDKARAEQSEGNQQLADQINKSLSKTESQLAGSSEKLEKRMQSLESQAQASIGRADSLDQHVQAVSGIAAKTQYDLDQGLRTVQNAIADLKSAQEALSAQPKWAGQLAEHSSKLQGEVAKLDSRVTQSLDVLGGRIAKSETDLHKAVYDELQTFKDKIGEQLKGLASQADLSSGLTGLAAKVQESQNVISQIGELTNSLQNVHCNVAQNEEQIKLLHALVAKLHHESIHSLEETQAKLGELLTRSAEPIVVTVPAPQLEVVVPVSDLQPVEEQEEVVLEVVEAEAEPVAEEPVVEEATDVPALDEVFEEVLEVLAESPKPEYVEEPVFELPIFEEPAVEEVSVASEVPEVEAEASQLEAGEPLELVAPEEVAISEDLPEEEPVVAVQAEELPGLDHPLEESVAELIEEPTVEEVASPAAELVELEVAEAATDETAEEEDELPVFTGLRRSWSGAGGSPARHWSCETKSATLLKPDGALRPLKPVDTPDIASPIGAMVYVDRTVLYAHGEKLRTYWPGKDDRFFDLSAAVPDGDWRLLAFEGNLYVAQENQVEVFDLTTHSQQGILKGRYVDQTHTEFNWVGLKKDDLGIQLEFRNTAGQLLGDGHQFMATAKVLPLIANNKGVYLGLETGELLLATHDKVDFLESPLSGEDEKLTFFTLYKQTLLAVVQSGANGWVKLLDNDGKWTKQLEIEEAHFDGNLVVMGDRLYIFDESQGDIVVVNLKKLSVHHREHVKGVKAVRKMVGIQAGKNQLLALACGHESEQGGRLFILDPSTGVEVSLGTNTQPHSDFLVADGHLVLAQSCSYQNTISVFDPLAAAPAKSRDAA